MVLLPSLLAGLAACGSDIQAASDEPHSVALEAAIDSVVERVAPRVVQLRYFGAGSDGLGAAAAPVTGYALDEHWIVTSSYALENDPAGVLCRFANGTQSQARVVARDHSRQVVLLCTDSRATPPPRLTGRDARVGETAIALGRVYAADSMNVAVGVVSAVGRLGGRAVQTDSLVSPANYGGPLVGIDGALLGIITPAAPPGQRGIDLYDSGVGFAVGAGQLAPRLPTLAAGRDLHPGWLGVTLPKEDPLRASAKLTGVAGGGPAAEAGLAAGDTILFIGQTEVTSIWSLRRALAGLDAGAEVEVTYRRGSASASGRAATRETTVTLGVAPADLPDGTEGAIDVETKKPGEP